MAEKEILFKINGKPAADTIKGIQEQIKALDEQIATSSITDPNFDNLINESKKAKESLQTLQNEGVKGVKPEGITGSLKGFVGQLEKIPGPVGGAIQGVVGLTRASLAFIATPIGAIVAAIVVVFQAFQKAVASSEKAQFALNKIMGAFTGIIGPVVKFLGEFVAVMLEGVVGAIDAVVSGLAALGIDFAENAKAGMELADSLNAIEEAEGDLEVARAQQNKSLAEARDLLTDTNAKYEDRRKALDEIKTSEEALAAKEVELAKKRVAAAEETIRLYGESKENLDALDAATIKLANTETDYYNKKRQFNKEEKKLLAEQQAAEKQAAADAEARRKEALAKQKEYNDNRAAAQKGTQEILDNLALRAIKDEEVRETERIRLKLENDAKEARATIKNKKDLDARLAALEKQAQSDIDLILENAQKKRKEELDKYYNEQASGLEQSQYQQKATTEKYYDDLLKASQDYYVQKNSETTIELSKDNALIQSSSVAVLKLQQEQADKEKKIREEKSKALQILNDKFLKEETNKDLEALKARQEAILLETKAAAAKERDAILNDKEATNTAKLNAEIEYNKKVRDLEAQNLQEQIDLIRATAYETEEAKQQSNLEILRLQDQLNEKLKEKYKQDNENFATKTKDFIDKYQEQIDAFIQAFQAVVDTFQAYLDYTYQVGYEKEKARFEERQSLLDAQYENDIAAAEGNEAKKAEIKAEYEYQKALAAYDRDLAVYKLEKEGFENGKKVQIAQAIIAGIQGALGAFSSLAPIPYVGPVLGGIAAAAAAATAAFQVATIKKTTFDGVPPTKPTKGGGEQGGGGVVGGSKFAEGGLLVGRKHQEGGIATPFGELEGGEFVVNRMATKSFLPMLEKINSMGSGSGAPNNLSVVGEQSVETQPMPIIKTYVVASEVSSQQEANKRINDIARL